MNKELQTRMADFMFLLGAGLTHIQNLCRPMPAKQDKPGVPSLKQSGRHRFFAALGGPPEGLVGDQKGAAKEPQYGPSLRNIFPALDFKHPPPHDYF